MRKPVASSKVKKLVESIPGNRQKMTGAPRRPPTPILEMKLRVEFALDLLQLGLTETQVVRTLQLPPVKPGEKDARGQPKVGGLALTKGQARTAVDRAYRRAELRWETNRGLDRISQKTLLEAAIAGAMADRKWSSVASLSHELARITGTHEPIEVEVSTADARKKAMMALIAGMPDAEFAELLPAAAEGGEPPMH